MKKAYTASIRLLILLAVAFSLASIPGPLSKLESLFPILPLARATPAPAEQWYPAGPAMDTMLAHIFSDEVSEFNAIGAATPVIDTTDFPLTRNLLDPGNPSSFVNNPNLLVTSPVTSHGYYELEFMLANNFWGINMQFGNNPNGVQLRQGISHLINKNIFVSQQGDIGGLAHAVDSPIPYGSNFTSSGTTYTFNNPNSCNWDLNFTETGTVCTQTGGPPGGVAYGCAAPGITSSCTAGVITGTINFPWQPQIGSADFCAAADHFITAFRHAGIATLTKNANCVLQPPAGMTWGSTQLSPITSNPISPFIRLDHHPRFEMGTSISQEICALWTGFLTSGCNFPGTNTPAVAVHTGDISAFCGYTTSTTGVNPCWWIYTGGFDGMYPIDQSLFYNYNSRFVSGVCTSSTNCITATFGGTCSNNSVPTPAAADYIYLCNNKYDADSTSLEFASSVANAFSAATTTADDFGRGAYTIPIWTDINQNAYLKGWQRILNTDGSGVFPATQFTWLNDYNPAPALTGTVRQGFKQTTRSLNPYIAETKWDKAILTGVFDTPLLKNLLNNGQLLDWMTTSHSVLPSSQLGYPQCAPPPSPPVQPCYPASTIQNLRLNLRNDIFFQDGHQMTGFDIKFAYATLDANGAFIGTSLAAMTCARDTNANILFNCTDGVTVRSKGVVDIHLDSFGPFTTISVGTTFVFPGRYWSANCAGTKWDADAAMGNVPDSCMTLDPSKAGFSYDPIANHILVGSGPWECADILGGTGAVGFGCSDTGTQNPPVDHTYTLTRFGKGTVPGSTTVGTYFRSSGTLALYIWAIDTGDTAADAILISGLETCNTPNQPPPTQPSTCSHWQHGIGALNGQAPVTQSQVNIFLRFLDVSWIPPFTWANSPCTIPFGQGPINCSLGSIPDGMNQPTPILYEGVNSMYPARVVGCTNLYNPTNPSSGGYDC
jgi:hypothetical protein